MATNFPTSLDSFTNPSSSSTLDSPSHAAQHANINDAMEAVQAKLGTGAGTIGTWTAYTPTFTNLTVGNATVAFKYSVINKIVFVEGLLTLGSTSSVGTEPFFTLPVNRAISTLSQIGVGTYADVGTATYMAYVLNVAASNRCYLYALNAGGAGGLAELTVTNTVPFTWANGDRIQVSIRYEAA